LLYLITFFWKISPNVSVYLKLFVGAIWV